MVIFLRCNTNNRATTVLQDFLRGCELFGLPSRVRADYGGENVDVASYMLEVRGTGRGTFLTGASVHNQRIERLWRDVGRLTIKRYRMLFTAMENQGLLNQDNRLHRMAPHFVYRPRIQRSLDEFALTWNYHKIDTERNRTPRQLFIDAAFSAPGIAGDDPEVVDTEYGMEEGNTWDDISEVDAEDAISDVDAVELDDVLGDDSNIVNMLCLEINPLDEDDEDGVLWYRHAVDLLEHSIAE